MKRKQPTVELEQVDATRAAKLLQKNVNNRHLRPAHVEFLARAMRDGKFEVTHQGIALNAAGELVDGQHRLSAIVKTGLPQWLFVAHGVEAAGVDIGIVRTLNDRLHVDGPTASIARLFYRVACGNSRPQDYEAQLIIDAFMPQIKELHAIGAFGNRGNKGVNTSPVTAAACLRLYHHRGADYAAVLESVAILTRADLPRFTPALSSFYKQAQNMSYGSDAQLEWFTRAWVAFDPKGTERTRIQLKTRAVPLEEAREVIHTATAGNFK